LRVPALLYDVDLDDPRLADYRDIKDRQLAEAFREHAPGVGRSGDPEAPHGRFMAEGEVVFRVLARSGLRVLSVLCTPTRLETLRDVLTALEGRTPVYVLPSASVNRLVGFPLHRGLMAIGARPAPRPVASVVDRAVERRGMLLVLDALTNHDNVGGCFRSAAAFGAAGVLLSGSTVDPLYRKSLRVSVGHALRVPFARHVGATIELVRSLQSRGVQVAALTTSPDAVDLRSWAAGRRRAEGAVGPDGSADRPMATPMALVLGAEGAGLDEDVQKACDVRVRIGMRPGVDSLNVVVAGSIALHEMQQVC
jgi:tRNA G18 (ribose-2'-O)-methylase SpoU